MHLYLQLQAMLKLTVLVAQFLASHPLKTQLDAVLAPVETCLKNKTLGEVIFEVYLYRGESTI